ncbi:MAG TPA: GAF domain-containing sensor histidine kinase [Clostridiaceae bacterium]|nr:GAF domain-containing sensor histidine kinase [Clostridiaceae bacterium]
MKDENMLLLNEFYKIGRLLSTEQDTIKLLEIILDSSIKLTSSDAGTIYLVIDKKEGQYSYVKRGSSNKGKLLKFVISKNMSMDISLEKSFSSLTEKSIVGYSVINGKSVRIDDAYNIPPELGYVHNHEFDRSTGYITKSILSVPMKDRDNNVTGVIQLINKKKQYDQIIDYKDKNYIDNILTYNHIDELIMNSLAGQAAVALQNNILRNGLEKLLQEYKQQNKQLLFLSKKILVSHEEERKRIARDIHDGPAQSMANLSLRLELCKRNLQENNTEHLLEELDSIKHSIKSTLKEIRAILYDLKPSFLEDGIIEALNNYVYVFKENTGINVDLKISGDDSKLEYYMTSTIYRIVQESLTNISKHSQAKNAYIDFSIGNENIVLVIKDDGKGFDMSKKEKEKYILREKGFGLEGMKERVSLLRGKVSITSHSGKGTEVKVEIPIPWALR